jgi:hypothetical protein
MRIKLVVPLRWVVMGNENWELANIILKHYTIYLIIAIPAMYGKWEMGN